MVNKILALQWTYISSMKLKLFQLCLYLFDLCSPQMSSDFWALLTSSDLWLHTRTRVSLYAQRWLLLLHAFNFMQSPLLGFHGYKAVKLKPQLTKIDNWTLLKSSSFEDDLWSEMFVLPNRHSSISFSPHLLPLWNWKPFKE